ALIVLMLLSGIEKLLAKTTGQPSRAISVIKPLSLGLAPQTTMPSTLRFLKTSKYFLPEKKTASADIKINCCLCSLAASVIPASVPAKFGSEKLVLCGKTRPARGTTKAIELLRFEKSRVA